MAINYHAGNMQSIRLVIQQDKSEGYDYQFVSTVPDRFKCSICKKVLREPELVVCCGNHYCSECLKTWFSKQRKESCPSCKAEGSKFQHVQNRGLKSEINQLKLYCPNRGSGCTWSGELGGLTTHLESRFSGCNYAQVECTNRCGAKPSKKDLATHLRTQCPLRLDVCQHCKKQDTFKALEAHKSTCPKYPVYCPNSCSVRSLTRENLPAHLNSCPLARGPCPFEEAGCTVRDKPDQIKKHVASNQAQHLMMLMETNKKTLAQLKETKQELQDTKKELAKTNNKLELEAETMKSLKRALAFEVSVIQQSGPGNDKIGAFRSIQAQLTEEELEHLDSLIFRVLDFSKHVRENTTWYSSPFILEGYRVCLSVHPKGLGSAVGTHASLSLVLLDIVSSSPDSEEFNSALDEVRILVPLFNQDGNKVHRVFLKEVKSGRSLDLSPLKAEEKRRVLGTINDWLVHVIVAKELERQSFLMKVERGGSFGTLHTAALASAMRASAMMAARDECRQS